MKRIVCEMCGSSDMLKQDGVYVCQSCGTKYSVEEARKMMIEGTVDVSGSKVIIDNSSYIANYYQMAESAFISKNYLESLNYCNKIIETDSNNSRAWLLKGKASGWQSTLADIRMEEALNCFDKAIDVANDKEKNDIRDLVISESESLFFALIKLCCDHFYNYPSYEAAQILIGFLNKYYYKYINLLLKNGISIERTSYKLSDSINKEMLNVWNNKIWTEYQGTGLPNDNDLIRFREHSNATVSILYAVINLKQTVVAEDKYIYEGMIVIYRELMESCSYRYIDNRKIKSNYFKQKEKQQINNQVLDCFNKIKMIDPSYVMPARKSTQKGLLGQLKEAFDGIL